jgi:ABC-type bacteriocin/lantibiotic exporters, contain an N-terminal double-glycine peptidase domain
MKILLEIWRLLDRRQRREAVLLQVVSMLMALSTLGGIAAILPFFSVLAEPHSIHRSAVLSFMYAQLHIRDERAFSILLGLAFVLVVVVANAVNLLGSRAISRYAYSVGSHFGCRLFDEYLRRDYGFHARADVSALASNVLFEAGRVTGGILQNGLILMTNATTIVLIVVSMVILNPMLALCASVLLALSYSIIYVLARQKLLQNGRLESEFLVKRTRVVNESLEAIKEIAVTQTQPFFLQKFAQASEAIKHASVSTLTLAQSPKYVLETLTAAALVGFALFLSGEKHAGVPWAAQLSFVGFAAFRLLPALQQVFYAMAKMRADTPALSNVAADLRAARDRGSTSRPNDSEWRNRPTADVQLRAVSFRYEAALPFVISDVSLRIPAGAIVAIVGHNGAGKTALADLILGLLLPQSGEIAVDGVVIDETNRHAWQSRVAYVPQNIVLLDTSVAENIALGFADRDIDLPRLHEAARLARVDEFIDLLPERYATKLGERGIRLSGGQRQRIGIARALYRDASVLVLDEATSALDQAAEHEVVTAIDTLRGQRTIVVIAHTQSILRNADLVFEVTKGSVACRGPGRELVALSRFAR